MGVLDLGKRAGGKCRRIRHDGWARRGKQRLRGLLLCRQFFCLHRFAPFPQALFCTSTNRRDALLLQPKGGLTVTRGREEQNGE